MGKIKKIFQFIVDLSTVIKAVDIISEVYIKNYDKINLAVAEKIFSLLSYIILLGDI